MGSYRCKQGILRLARVESRVLHDDGHVRFDQDRIRCIGRNFFRVMKIVKAQMLGAPGGNRKFVGTDWIAIFKKNCDRDVRVFL